jgi:ABC-2 type transport system ATP-binding protein
VLGLLEPQSGQVRVLGEDASRHGIAGRRRLGYMPEHDCLPPGMTANDLVVHLGELRGLPRRVAIRRASEALFTVGLEEERSRLIGTYSTGMKQRAKLAQAIVHAPSLVLLDEPTTGLDPAGRAEMLELVRRLSRELGISVLVSSHVLDDIERTCDAVVVLRDGRVAAQDTLAALTPDNAAGVVADVGEDAVERLVAALGARGVTATASGATGVHLARGDDAALDALRDVLAELDVPLRRLAPAGRTIEDVLVDVIAEGAT